MPLTNWISVSTGIELWNRRSISSESAKLPAPKYARITASVGATACRSGVRRGITLTSTAPMSNPLVIAVVDEMNRYGLPQR